MIPHTQWQPGVQGVFECLPAETYHAAPGVSHSMLCHMDPPARLPAYLTQPREVSIEMMLGTLTHAMILEPDKPLPKIVVQPETYPAQPDSAAVKSKKAAVGDPLPWHNGAHYCKRWHAEAREAGLLPVTQAQHDALHGMVLEVSRKEPARRLLAECETEVSVFVDWEYHGAKLLRKARLDAVPRANVLCDIKTCDDASPDAFAKKLEDGYATQAAYYLDAWNEAVPHDQREGFVFVAVERRPPYLVACYVVDQRALAWARERNFRRLRDYLRCSQDGLWTGFPDEFVTLDLPGWAYKRTDQSERIWG